MERKRGREATKVLFCPGGTRELLHERWRKEGRKEGRSREGGGMGRVEEEEKKAPSGISWPAAPSGTRHERHFYSDRKSDSRGR